ncbi:hypothetical protein BH11BAC1_BH11BAC1_17210 [soil metagenome]
MAGGQNAKQTQGIIEILYTKSISENIDKLVTGNYL